jgi:nudix-type nucleoside diphosphatase (YffH/AdpP family)
VKPERVEIIDEQTVFQKHFFVIKEARLRHALFNGDMSPELDRLNFERGDSVAVVLHDPHQDAVILTEQFRYPTYEKGPGWMLEIPAGVIEIGENQDPKVTLKRELMEEVGYDVSAFQRVYTFYVSPGGTSERIHLYSATATAKNKIGSGGGLAAEGEYIRFIWMPFDEALNKIEAGEIVDAKSIIGLQWLQLRRKAKRSTESTPKA